MPLHEHPLAHRLCSEILAETQGTIFEEIQKLGVPRAPRPRLLDVGCWDGEATERYGRFLNAEMAGIEVFSEPAKAAVARGIEVAELDLELKPFPWANGRFDLVVANQVFEHLKNIWLPLVISVPNLASVHNRILLALGVQPTSIRTLGVHVRGYTLRELLGLVTLGGAFKVRSVLGVGFHPLPPRLARPLTRLWPGGSHTSVVVVLKTRDFDVPPWQAYRQHEIDAGVQTFYS
jgi:SAM-dependent methyltransferase